MALVVAGVVAASLWACGGGAGDAVVTVGDRSITRATLEHWIPIEAVLSYQLVPGRPVPRGVVPDPPRYTACVAYLKRAAADAQPKPTAPELRTRCRQEHAALREHVQSLLIRFAWLSGESAELGIEIGDAAVERKLRQLRSTEFQAPGSLQRFLAYTGMSVADERWRIRMSLLTVAVHRAILARERLGVRQQQRALAPVTARWKARTSCRRGFVVPMCEQYRGAVVPGEGI